jgi:hypothetical protein
MKITEKQIAEFAEANDMILMGFDWFEDAGGNVIHESEVEDMIKEERAKALNHLFGDVAGALDSLTITK